MSLKKKIAFIDTIISPFFEDKKRATFFDDKIILAAKIFVRSADLSYTVQRIERVEHILSSVMLHTLLVLRDIHIFIGSQKYYNIHRWAR